MADSRVQLTIRVRDEIPWLGPPLPCPVDPNCTVDHLRRKKNRAGKGSATASGSPGRTGGERRG